MELRERLFSIWKYVQRKAAQYVVEGFLGEGQRPCIHPMSFRVAHASIRYLLPEPLDHRFSEIDADDSPVRTHDWEGARGPDAV